VRYGVRQFNGKLDQALINAILPPWELGDQLLPSTLLDGVDVRGAGFEKLREQRPRRLGVAAEQIPPDQILTAVGGESLDRAIIHIERHAFPVADRNCDREFAAPVGEIDGWDLWTQATLLRLLFTALQRGSETQRRR